MSKPRFISQHELAGMMDVHVKTLQRWRREDPQAFPDPVDDPGTAVRRSKPVRWREDDIREFLERRGYIAAGETLS